MLANSNIFSQPLLNCYRTKHRQLYSFLLLFIRMTIKFEAFYDEIRITTLWHLWVAFHEQNYIIISNYLISNKTFLIFS